MMFTRQYQKIFVMCLYACIITCSKDKQKVTKADLEPVEISEKRVDTLLFKGDTLLALKTLEKMLLREPNASLINRYREINLAFNSQDQQIKFFKQLASKKADNADVHFGLGMAYIDKIQKSPGAEAGMLAGLAIDEFKRAIGIDSLHWSAHYALGLTYSYMPAEFNLTEEAIKTFHRLIDIQKKSDTLLPQYAYTYVSLGDVYMKAEEHNKAIAIWQEGLKLFPDEAELKKRLKQKGEEPVAE